MKFSLGRLRVALLLYVGFDLLFGGVCGGFFTLTPAAAAQFTQVSGTVTDPNGLPYANGTITANLVTSASPTLNGLPYSPPTQPVGLDSTGSFVMQLADNTQLSPGGTQWSFTVCSAGGTVQPSGGKGPICFSISPITIAGTIQSITANLVAAAPALTTSTSGGGVLPPSPSFQSITVANTGTFGTTGQQSVFLNPDQNNVPEYTGGANNSLDQLNDVLGILYWNPTGSGGNAQQVLTGIPYPLGTSPASGLVYANVAGQGLMLGAPANFPNGVSSDAWLNVFNYGGPTDDACTRINKMLTAATAGQVGDARGLAGHQKCLVNPIPSNAQGSLLLGPAIFHLQTTVVSPGRFDGNGLGWDANPPAGLGATTFQACPNVNQYCPSVFPGTNGAILFCWGSNGTCGVGGGTPLFDSPWTGFTFDCQAMANCIAVQGMVNEEGSDLVRAKFENCLNTNSRCLEIAGGSYPSTGAGAQVTVTNGSASVSNTGGTAFTVDMLNNQIQFTSQAGVNYVVTAVTPTALTISPAYSGTTSATANIAVSNAATQNSAYRNLYIVSLAGANCDHTGVHILMNTGSGSNAGPKYIDQVTTVDGCTNQPDYDIRLSGAKTYIHKLHQESYGIAGTVFGLDSNTSEVGVEEIDSSVVTAGSASQVLISNAFTPSDIYIKASKAVGPNAPTNIIADQFCSHTVTWASEPKMGMYFLGADCNHIITDSTTLPSGFTGLNVTTGYGFSATSAASGTDFFQPASNTIGVSINGTESVRFTANGLKLPGTLGAQWTNGTIGGTVDLSLGRASANTLTVGTTSGNGLGFLESSGVRVTANATFGTGGNVTTGTSLTAIPGLSWSIPAVAQAYKIDCFLIYTQATAAAANSIGIQTLTTSPQHGFASGRAQITIGPPSTYAENVNTSLANTTADSVVTFTPGAINVGYGIEFHATVLASGSGAATINILGATGNAADLLTITGDSSCHIEVTNN